MDTANVVIRKAEFEDIPILEGLIRESVRTLQAHDYSPRQMEGALGTVFGVDRQLIRDGTDRLPGIRSRLTDDKRRSSVPLGPTSPRSATVRPGSSSTAWRGNACRGRGFRRWSGSECIGRGLRA